MADTILQGEKITRVFHQGKTETKVLDGIDINLYEKDFTVIMGPSGAGKSTLLYALSGMDRITGGHVLYRDKKLTGLSEKQMARLRAEEFGFVFQQTHLVSNLTLLVPLCYCKNLKLIHCEMIDTDLAFEKSQVEATLTAPIISIKNPLSGRIYVPKAEEIIMDDEDARGEIIICTQDNCNAASKCICA